MQSNFLPHPKGRIHYLQFGQGPELLIALHGFSDRARIFAVLEPALATHYTVIAPDWPFHGQTEWSGDTFSKADLLDIIEKLVEKAGKTRFSLLAYSFGGRLAQAMLPDLIGRLNHLYLFAPDGIQTKGMSTAARIPMWFRRAMLRALRRPEWFVKLINWGRRARLVPPMIHHFLTNNLTKPERFRRTFGCWLALDSFYLGRRKMRALLEESGLKTEIYIGARDEVIGSKALHAMVDGLPNVRLHVIDEGHRLIGERLAAAIIKNR